MRYCNECAEKLGWPQAAPPDRVEMCEVCGRNSADHERESRDLPKLRVRTVNYMAQAIMGGELLSKLLDTAPRCCGHDMEMAERQFLYRRYVCHACGQEVRVTA